MSVLDSPAPPAPAAAVRKPDFLIIGAAKSGTTTLYEYLCRHPQVFMPAEKEPEFFADKFHRGWDWYGRLFADAGSDRICGEASTIYTWWQDVPTAAERIGQSLPAARLILLCRHPVDRLYSHYCEQLRAERKLNGGARAELQSFEAFVAGYPHCTRSSDYAWLLEQYTRHVKSENLLVLLLDDLRRDPAGVLHRVFAFLGVDPAVDVAGDGAVHARQSATAWQWQTRQRLTAGLRRVPGVRQLAAAMPLGWRERAYRWMESTPWGRRARRELEPPPMSPATRRMLLERFRPSVRRLGEFLQRDLSAWER